MLVVDDYGRFYSQPATIRGACWPRNPERATEKQVAQWLLECTSGERPLVLKYEADGSEFIEIADFGQRLRAASKFPDPVRYLTATCPQNDECSRRRNAKTKSETKANTHEPVGSDSFEEVWTTYPNKQSKGQAERTWKKLAPNPELVAEILAAIGAQIAWRKEAAAVNQWTPEWTYFSTWLNDKRWLDVIPEVKQPLQSKDDKCPICKQSYRVHLSFPKADGTYCP